MNEVIVINLKTKDTKTFNNLKDAAFEHQTNDATLRVSCCETKRFLLGKRAVPKYYLAKVFLYKKDYSPQAIKTIEALSYKCKICFCCFDKPKNLSTHIQNVHNLTTEKYTVQQIYNGKKPSCSFKNCDNNTRYSNYAFKKFCKMHSKEAMKIGGGVGGKAQSWNKGLTKKDDVRIMKQAIQLMGEGNPFFGKTHSKETIEKIVVKKTLSINEVKSRLDEFEKYYEFTYDIQNYVKRDKFFVKAKCKKCKFEQNKKFVSIERGTLCKKCYPFTTSKAELEIGDYIENLGLKIVRNDRSIIRPYELDIFVPEHNFAIEHNGLYWHMDRGQKAFNKNLHKTKLSLCNKKGIQLLHIFSDEWNDKKDLVKSMIAYSLEKLSNKLHARKCVIANLNPLETKNFFNENHISGNTKNIKAYGLMYNNDIVCALSIRYPFHRKRYINSIEIARFATKKYTVVRGGFSKLLEPVLNFCKQERLEQIISYCDASIGDGGVYHKNGFSLLKGNSGINYWYTDGTKRYDRFKFRAQNGKSEKQIAKENNVYRIYGCGNLIFEKQVS